MTNKALSIARRLKLTQKQLEFIEEAGMLHDIGICKVNAPEMGANGSLPYLTHLTEGQKILEREGLAKHAKVAHNHIGVGLTKEEITNRNLPLPVKDISPMSIEEKIISYADLFFSKRPKSFWIEKTEDEVITELEQYGEEDLKTFRKWSDELSGNDSL